MNQSFKYCKKIEGLDNTLFFSHEDYFSYVTKHQISGLVPRKSPFLTGGYWDDISSLGALAPAKGKLAVLGSGLLSFLPHLIANRDKSLQIDCVEKNKYILNLARTIADLYPNNSDINYNYICSDVLTIDNSFFNHDVVFINVYNETGISPISLDKSLHSSLYKGLSNNSFVAININDVDFHTDKPCSTRLFYESLRDIWPHTYLLRRESSTTMILQKSSESIFLQKVNNPACSFSLTPYLAHGKADQFFTSPLPEHLDDHLLDFRSDQVAINKDKNALISKAIEDFQNLGLIDIIKLQRRAPDHE